MDSGEEEASWGNGMEWNLEREEAESEEWNGGGRRGSRGAKWGADRRSTKGPCGAVDRAHGRTWTGWLLGPVAVVIRSQERAVLVDLVQGR